MPDKNLRDSEKKSSGLKQREKEGRENRKISKHEARRRLKTFQAYMSIIFVVSGFFGIYLLVTDLSLWRLAVSHAYALVGICTVDFILAGLGFFSFQKVVIPSVLWAMLTVFLQLGDIITAPQYKMTPQYFATYLFGLWAFDALLIAQIVVIGIGIVGRNYIRTLRKRRLTYFDIVGRKSRRDFLQILTSISVLVAIAGILGFVESSSTNNNGTSLLSQTTQQRTGSSSSAGPIANINSLAVGNPIYFNYPSSGYPNILFKRADGSLKALSLLCTHVCCECQLDASSSTIVCPCHGSIFDENGNVLRGPATLPLPSVRLSVDASGNITPTGITGSTPCSSV